MFFSYLGKLSFLPHLGKLCFFPYLGKLDFSPYLCKLYFSPYLGKPNKPMLTPIASQPYVGESVTLSCLSTSTTVPSNHNLVMKYTWVINGTSNPTDPRYSYSSTKNTLTVSDIRQVDATKTFICRAIEDIENGYTSDNSDISGVNVLCRYSSIFESKLK